MIVGKNHAKRIFKPCHKRVFRSQRIRLSGLLIPVKLELIYSSQLTFTLTHHHSSYDKKQTP